MAANVVVKGADDIVRKLKELRGALQRSILGRAENVAMTPMLRKVKSTVYQVATKRTGLLKKSLAKVQKRKPKKGVVYTIIGPDKRTEGTINLGTVQLTSRGRTTDILKKVKPVKYAHLVEQGHKVKFSKNGPVVGFCKPRPFLGPSFAATASAAKDTFMTKVDEGIQREVARLGAQGVKP